MKETVRTGPGSNGRRRFLGLLGGMSAATLVPSLLARTRRPRARDLREADFYRPHDLAG
jgi:hypothetical protein